jgi:hypothetical protein
MHVRDQKPEPMNACAPMLQRPPAPFDWPASPPLRRLRVRACAKGGVVAVGLSLSTRYDAQGANQTARVRKPQ